MITTSEGICPICDQVVYDLKGHLWLKHCNWYTDKNIKKTHRCICGQKFRKGKYAEVHLSMLFGDQLEKHLVLMKLAGAKNVIEEIR